ncbi:hypothetical protein IH992_19560 [Candidatus Poribacteria bacterium]|nr:hypothetical protein [Candidatus Poribacteria bacterium]
MRQKTLEPTVPRAVATLPTDDSDDVLKRMLDETDRAVIAAKRASKPIVRRQKETEVRKVERVRYAYD